MKSCTQQSLLGLLVDPFLITAQSCPTSYFHQQQKKSSAQIPPRNKTVEATTRAKKKTRNIKKRSAAHKRLNICGTLSSVCFFFRRKAGAVAIIGALIAFFIISCFFISAVVNCLLHTVGKFLVLHPSDTLKVFFL